MDITLNNISIHNIQYGATHSTPLEKPIHIASQPNAMLYNYKLYALYPPYQVYDLTPYTPHLALLYDPNNIIVYSKQRKLLTLITIEQNGSYSQQLILTDQNILTISIEQTKICIVLSNGIIALMKFYMLDCLQNSYSYAFGRNMIEIRKWFTEVAFDEYCIFQHYGLQLYVHNISEFNIAHQHCNMVMLIDDCVHVITLSPNNRYLKIKPNLKAYNGCILNEQLIAVYLANNSCAIYNTNTRQLSFMLIPYSSIAGIRIAKDEMNGKSQVLQIDNKCQYIVTVIESNGYVSEIMIPQQRVEWQAEYSNKSIIHIALNTIQCRICTTPVAYCIISESCIAIANASNKLVVYTPLHVQPNEAEIKRPLLIKPLLSHEASTKTTTSNDTNSSHFSKRTRIVFNNPDKSQCPELGSSFNKYESFGHNLKKAEIHKTKQKIQNKSQDHLPIKGKRSNLGKINKPNLKEKKAPMSINISNNNHSNRSDSIEYSNKSDEQGSKEEKKSELADQIHDSMLDDKYKEEPIEYNTTLYSISPSEVETPGSHKRDSQKQYSYLPSDDSNKQVPQHKIKLKKPASIYIQIREALINKRKKIHSFYNKISKESAKNSHHSSSVESDESLPNISNIHGNADKILGHKSRNESYRNFYSMQPRYSCLPNIAEVKTKQNRDKFKIRKSPFVLAIPKIINYSQFMTPHTRHAKSKLTKPQYILESSLDVPDYFISRPHQRRPQRYQDL